MKLRRRGATVTKEPADYAIQAYQLLSEVCDSLTNLVTELPPGDTQQILLAACTKIDDFLLADDEEEEWLEREAERRGASRHRDGTPALPNIGVYEGEQLLVPLTRALSEQFASRLAPLVAACLMDPVLAQTLDRLRSAPPTTAAAGAPSSRAGRKRRKAASRAATRAADEPECFDGQPGRAALDWVDELDDPAAPQPGNPPADGK